MTDAAPDAPTTDQRSSAEVVRAFLTAFADGNADLAVSLVADDLVYENVSLPTIRGKRRFEKGAHDFFKRGLGFDVVIHRITEDGATVMTERTDAITYRRFRSQFWVCGVFEVHDGLITLWRDYFDWQDVTIASLRGLVATVVPSLRESF
ncbi:MAG TPA: limonene-1,2-epoxide hydrolase family protein [Mycobacteriales bacterium]|nr:limonene-1,2-epoxide hydrolase family protein [Mycobacteriales bacterium]